MLEINDNKIILEERFLGFRDRILTTLNELLKNDFKEIIIDMVKVDFIDSIAIGDLVKCHLTCKAKKVKLNLANINQDIKRSLIYAGLAEMFNLEDPSKEGLGGAT